MIAFGFGTSCHMAKEPHFLAFPFQCSRGRRVSVELRSSWLSGLFGPEETEEVNKVATHSVAGWEKTVNT